MTGMTDKPVLEPGPSHPISVEPNLARVVVTIEGRVVADTRRALTLQEANYPAVQYIPIEDADKALLKRSDTSTYCPYKGDASYYSLTVGGPRTADAVWVYETPHAAVAQIKNHLAFYPDRVDAITEHGAAEL